MNRKFAKSTAVLLALAVILPVFCSCSFFAKSKVLEVTTKLVDGIKDRNASDILDCTDGLKRDFKKSFKDTLGKTMYTNEDMAYQSAVFDTLKAEIKSDQIDIQKDEATCPIEFTIADVDTLQGGDYADAAALADAVSKCPVKTIKVNAELKKIDKEWLVTNFDSSNFQEVFSFFGKMPPIARGAFLATVDKLPQAVIADDPVAVNNLLYSPNDAMNPVTEVFNMNANPTIEEKAFQAAVRSTMTYKINESTLSIKGNKGTIDIEITMADYETLAGKQFNSIPEIVNAVNSCGTKTLKYTCKMVRTAYVWAIVNIDSEEFAAFLNYKKFSIDIKKVDGKYSSSVDVTDKFTAYVASEFKIKMPSDLDGRIIVNSTLILDNGNYKLTVDRDGLESNIKSFAERNIDKIIMSYLGTTSQTGLDTLSKIAGYKDYADMKKKILEEISRKIQSVDISSMNSSGRYTVNDNQIALNSGVDVLPGTIDNYGVITVTVPIKDPDAKMFLGTDTMTLPFSKTEQ